MNPNCLRSVLPILGQSACSHSYPPPCPIQPNVAWAADGKYCELETVLALPDDALLVSNIRGFESTGDRSLSLLDARGNAIDWRVINELDAVLGMALKAGEYMYPMRTARSHFPSRGLRPSIYFH